MYHTTHPLILEMGEPGQPAERRDPTRAPIITTRPRFLHMSPFSTYCPPPSLYGLLYSYE